MTTFYIRKNQKKENKNMLQNNEKSAEVLKAEKIVEQAKARLAEVRRQASQQKRKSVFIFENTVGQSNQKQ